MTVQTWNSRLSINEVCTFRWSFEEDVIRYRQLGFDAIGVWRAKISDYGTLRAQAILAESELKVASMHWIGGFTGTDGRSFRDAMVDAYDAIELAAAIGAQTVVLVSGGRGGHTNNHVRKTLQAALKDLSEAAQSRSVHIAIEPMHVGVASEFTFLTSLPDTLDLIEQVDHPNLGLVFDCYHMAGDPNLFDQLPDILSKTKLVQIGDAKSAPFGEQNRCLIGEGYLPIADVIREFELGGYDGYYEVELIGEDVEHVGYEEVLQSSRQKFSADLEPDR
jgi:sugar phosphate isomerase/epimerase